MSGCVTCGAPTSRRRCRDCQLAERDDDTTGGTGEGEDDA